MKNFTFSISLMILALSLASCSPAASYTPIATPKKATEMPTLIPTTPPPEATATAAPTEVSFQESEDFNPADHLTWSGELQTLYGSLKDRTAGGDQAVYAAQDIVMHERINSGLTNFLYGRGIDVRNGSEKEIVTAYGNWQKDNFTKTGEMVLMPADIAMMKSEMMNGWKGVTTDEVPLFGEKVKRALITGYENMTISAIAENPTDPNSVIINVTLEDGSMRPFQVNFEEKILNSEQLVYDKFYADRGSQKGPILTIAEDNDIRNKVDIAKYPFRLRATDGSGEMNNTSVLNLTDLLQILGTQVIGSQYKSSETENIKTDGNSYVAFGSLFDDKNGLEVLSGISNTDWTFLKP